MPVDAAAPSQATYDQQQFTQLLAQAGRSIEDCPDQARADVRNGLLELDRRYAQRFGADPAPGGGALTSADGARSLSLTFEAADRRSDSLPVTAAIAGEDCQLEDERAALRQAAAQAARLARLNPF
jgi:acetyl-CoA acetyltransferase